MTRQTTVLSDDQQRRPRMEGGLYTTGRVKQGTPTEPLVSVVTSSLNAASVLDKTIRSVANQTYRNVEYIIIDGASADGTVALLQQNSNNIDRWVSEPDAGIYDAWNKGVQCARGDWIAFLGAGDRLVPDAIDSLVAFAIRANQELDLISARVDVYRGDRFIRSVGQPWSWDVYQRYMGVAHPGALQNAKYFQRYGLFDPSFKVAADYELLLRAGPQLRTAFIKQSLVLMEAGGASASSKAIVETARAQVLHKVCSPFTAAMRAASACVKLFLRRATYGS